MLICTFTTQGTIFKTDEKMDAALLTTTEQYYHFLHAKCPNIYRQLTQVYTDDEIKKVGDDIFTMTCY